MKKYIGTKQVEAMPMTLGEYIAKTGRNPYEKDGKMHGGNEPGYLVKYKDGYESWSPAEPFEEAYRQVDDERKNMTFGDAIEVLKQGGAIRRTGWNGKGFLTIQVNVLSITRIPDAQIHGCHQSVMFLPKIGK